MAGILKEAKRGLRRRSGAFLHDAIHSSPSWLKRSVAPALCYAEMLLVDYGITRTIFANRHQIARDIWRSAQPAPHHLRWAATRGIKTVVNLRGSRDQSFGTRWLEEQACKRHGLKLVDLPLRSRAAPDREEFHAVRNALSAVTFPILVHCKSGADRAGLMSVLALHVHHGVPIEEARKQLSLQFGHVRHADTGLEFAGSSLNHLFAQRRNLFRPRFYRMLAAVNRFNSEAVAALDDPATQNETLGDYVRRRGYGEDFFNLYLVPMSSAVWSTPPEQMLAFPATSLLRFFYNYGFLGLNTQH